MSESKVKALQFWLCADAALNEIAERLVAAGIIANYQLDSENVYAWFTARLPGASWELNVSHKHHEDELTPDEPVCFLLMYHDAEPADAVVKDLARNVAHGLKTDVLIGTIQYLGGDDFSYHPQEQIRG